MKKFGKLLSLALVITILSTIFIPVKAAELTMPEEDICEELGIISGSGSGLTEQYLLSQATRFQAAVITLKLKGGDYLQTALNYPGEVSFDDASTAPYGDMGKKVLAYLRANPQLGWKAYSESTFRPNGTVTAQDFYCVLLQVLGYSLDGGNGGDFKWDNVYDFAEEKGMYLIAHLNELTIWDLAIATVEALQAEVKGLETTLIEKLVEDGTFDMKKAEQAGLFSNEPVSAEPTIDSITDIYLGIFDIDEEIELPEQVEVLYSDGTTALNNVTWEDATQTESEGLMVVAGYLDDTDIPVYAYLTIVQTPLQVLDITIENFKEVNIIFNKLPDETEVLNVKNYVVKEGSRSNIVQKAEFNAESKTATLLLNTAINEEEVIYITVKKALGMEKDQTRELSRFEDMNTPEIELVEAVGNKMIKIVYNEPVMNAGNVLNYILDGKVFSAVPTVDGRYV